MKIIDLECKKCGASMDFEEPDVEFTTEVNSSNNHILFYHKDDSTLKLECPYCHSKAYAWKSGKETSRVNGFTMNTTINGNGNQVVGIHIGGSVIGGNIIIGNNKVS